MKQLFTALLFLPFFAKAQLTFSPRAVGLIPPGYLINNIFTLNENEIWATASSADGTKPVIVINSTNNGNTWNKTKPDSNKIGYCLDIFAVDSKVVYVILEDQNGDDFTYRTTNSGVSWKNTSFSYGIYLHAYSASSVILLGAANAWYSNDSFNTNTNVPWSNGGPPAFTPFGFNALAGTQNHFISDSGLYFGYSKGSVVRTQNKGLKWKAFRTTLDTTGATSSLANSGNTLIALRSYLSNKGGLSRSTDGGHTWKNMSDSIPPGSEIQTVASSPAKPNYFLLGGFSKILKSTDGGMSWKSTTIPSTVSSTGAIHIAGVNDAWLGGDIFKAGAPALYKIDISGNSKVTNQQITNFKVYPNPVKGEFYYETVAPGSIFITDINGRTLLQMETLLGNGSVNLNSLPDGIYFVHFTSENTSVVTKIIKQSE